MQIKFRIRFFFSPLIFPLSRISWGFKGTFHITPGYFLVTGSKLIKQVPLNSTLQPISNDPDLQFPLGEVGPWVFLCCKMGQQACRNKDMAQSEAEEYELKKPGSLAFVLVTARSDAQK